MLQRLRALRNNGSEGGFTLIELLIVIVILGVLSAVVVFAVSAFNNDGKAAACQSDVKNVEVAAEAFYAKMHYAPANIKALIDAGYLKDQPSTANYTITMTNGVITVSNAPGSCVAPSGGPVMSPSA